jgi:hypothetical protein
MTDPPLRTGSNSDSADEPPGTPRWVKVFGIIAVIFVLLFIVLHLAGRGLGGH